MYGSVFPGLAVSRQLLPSDGLSAVLPTCTVGPGAFTAQPVGGAILSEIEEGDLDEDATGESGPTTYSGPSYEYATPGTEDWKNAHNEETRKALEELGVSIEHRFRQFLQITWNTVKAGKPTSCEHLYEGWDSLRVPRISALDRLPRSGPTGPKAGEIPQGILESGDFPAVAPGEAWLAPKGLHAGDSAQFLYQYITFRCEREVRKSTGRASEWWCCGRWYWWVLFVFTLTDEEAPTVYGTYKKGDGDLPDFVKTETGLSDELVVSSDTDLLGKYTCNSD